MNCSTFRKKMNDLLEGSVTHDMKTAMENHTEECSECRELYSMELTMEEAFKDAFSIKDVNFVSSREEIMKSIDKERYGKSAGKKLHFHFKKYSAAYISAAAFIAFAAVFTPYMIRSGHSALMSKNTANSANSMESKSAGTAPRMALKKSVVQDAKQAAFDAPESKTPLFSKAGAELQDNMPDFNTPWISSPSKKLSVSIEGRGAEARNEGIGVIYVKNLSNGAAWTMTNMAGDGKYSPIHLEWWDDENVLVTVGYAYGTMSKGGSVYLLNVETAAVSTVYVPENDRTQAVNAKRLGNKVQLQLQVYENENYDRSQTEERICETDMDSLVKNNSADLYVPELKAVYDFEKLANSRDYGSVLNLLAPSLRGSYTKDNEKLLKNINSMIITKLTEEPEWKPDKAEGNYYAYKVYYAEVYCTVKDESYSYLKNGVHSYKIVVAMEKQDSPWSIAEMSSTPPQ